MRKTISSYILKETLPIFFIGLLTFTMIILMDKILKLIEFIVGGISLSKMLMLLIYISPVFLLLTIPMALLLATLLAFGRMSGDSEIIACKASGISLYQLFVPVAVLSLAAWLFTTFLVFYGIPWGNQGLLSTIKVLAQSRGDIEIKERVFNAISKDMVVYVDRIPLHGRTMEGILIYDEKDKASTVTVFASGGLLIHDPQSEQIILRLINGNLHRFDAESNTYQKIGFAVYDFKIELGKIFVSIGKEFKEQELSVQELRRKLKSSERPKEEKTKLVVQLHKLYSIPVACIVFGLIGVPLGIQPRRSAKSYGFILSIFIILAYYISMTVFEILAMKNVLPAALAGWAPNLLFGMFGIYLLIKMANESPFKPLVWLIETIDSVQKRWKRVTGDD